MSDSQMSVDDLLSPVTLRSMIETFGDESRDRLFTQHFEAGEQTRPTGDVAQWDEIQMPRGLAPIVGPTSQFPRADNVKLVPRTVGMANIKLHTDLTAHRLFKQRAPGENVANPYAVIKNELKALRVRHHKTIEKMCCDTLNGRLLVDPTKYPGSTVPIDVNYQFTALLASADWSTASTPISKTDLPTMLDSYTSTSGLEAKTALINVSVEKQLRGNTDVQTWTANQRYAGNILESPVIDAKLLSGLQFGGLEWLKSNGYYADGTGTLTKFMPDNRAILLPEKALLPEILGMALGTGFVPVDVFGKEGALGFIEAASGFYAYSEIIKDGPVVRLYLGWIGLPYLKFPKGVGYINTHGS